MPTPSSNPPPDPSSTDSHNFSTCPEDAGTRPPPRSWQPPTGQSEPDSAMNIHGEDAERDTSPPPVGAMSPVAESATAEDRASAASSRSTTMSPRPDSAATAQTTPAPTGPFELDDYQKRDEAHDDPDNRRSNLSRGGGGGDCILSPRRQGNGPSYQQRPRTDVEAEHEHLSDEELMAPSMGSDYPSLRMIATTPSSFLRPGSKFHGTQQSERQVYDVQVEIKHVDLRESFLCGYLRIQGLTEDHPTLTTYFEGEIIGPKYNFYTNHESWGATNKIDLNHWKKFTAFRPFEKQARKGPLGIRDVAQRENIFMRWKEHFLVPDHRVRTISGASFEGFYYICFNQVKGEISGIYFHAKSEKFQQLELKHVQDKGCFSSVELR